MKAHTFTRGAAVALCLTAAFVAGCGGGKSIVPVGSPLVGNGSGPSGSTSTAHATLHIVVPQKTTTTADGRREPKYISASTTQLVYTVDTASETPIALTTANPECTTGGDGLQCTVPLTVAPGAHVFTFRLEDANGTALSAATDVDYTLVAGTNSTLDVTLGGIGTSIVLTPQSDANRVLGSTANGFQVYGNAAVQFAITILDADNNVIVGEGALTPSVSPSSGAPVTFASPSSSSSNVWTMTSTYAPTNPTTIGQTNFVVTATPYPNSGGNTVTSGTVSLLLYQPWIYVVNGSKVSAYDEQGNLKTVSITSGLSSPLGITVDANPTASPGAYVGDLFVTNAGGPSVGVYQPSGTSTASPGSFASLKSPGPITYDTHDNEFYIANTAGSTTMLAFTEAGAAGSFSSSATVANPTGLAYDATDNLIFLSSFTPDTITQYSEGGAVNTSWTANLDKPGGIAYDKNNSWLYVTNETNSSVTAFNKSGTQQTLSGFSGLSTPGPILVDPYSNVVYVGDKNSIKAYSESGTSVTLSANPSFTNAPTSMVLLP